MIYLQLFLAFLKIGAVSFGGGYGMISLMRETCLGYGWLTEEELMNFIAVAESTPGPIAVNMATFVGSSQGGILGSLLATLGIILPSFIVILIIASVMKNLMKYKITGAVLGGVRPAVIGLILGTAITMLLGLVFGISVIGEAPSFDLFALLIIAVVATVSYVFGRIRKAPPSPILLIAISAVLGIVFY